MPMTFASITLPLHDNHGKSTHNEKERILDMILNRFGGYTESGILSGVWKDDTTGKVYRDKVVRIDILANWETEYGSLLSIARVAAMLMVQECVLVVLPSGAHFVRPHTSEAIAAE